MSKKISCLLIESIQIAIISRMNDDGSCMNEFFVIMKIDVDVFVTFITFYEKKNSTGRKSQSVKK